MNQLTTIAALPSAGGCMAALPAEVGKPSGDLLKVNPSMFKFDWDWELDLPGDRLLSLKTPGLVITGTEFLRMSPLHRAEIVSKTKSMGGV